MARSAKHVVPGLARRFEAVIFDWDGTAVPDRRADAGGLRACIEHLCELGVDLAVVSGTHVGNVDGQLRARPRGPGRLHFLLNRGSEVFAVDEAGPRLTHRREATPEEDAALTHAAELAVARLAERGLETEIVSARLNRRKIDLIPEPAWADPPKARIAELLVAVEARLARAGLAGLREAVELARAAAEEAGLADPRVTSDVKHVEIGLTDKSDSARWILRDLWARGIGPGLVLVAGDELGPLGGLPGSDSFLLVPEAARATAVSVGVEPGGVPEGVLAAGGGPGAFLALLRDQLRRRERLELPRVDEAPGWTLSVEGLDPHLERAHEALLTLADGCIATSGIPLAAHPAITPGVLAAGVYAGEGAGTQLLPCPIWNLLPCEVEASGVLRRVLDLRTGIQRQELELPAGRLSGLLFSSLARPGTAALRAGGPGAVLAGNSGLVPPSGGPDTDGGESGGRAWMRASASSGGVIAAVSERRNERSADGVLERLATYLPDPVRVPPPRAARRRLAGAEDVGFERLLVEHRRAWAERWEAADIVIEGDPELQAAVRLALFHLMASAGTSGEAAVGARGLTGPGYRGHVFWDADVFVLPFLAATNPPAARAMLEYRLRRLPAARAAARAAGREGARFPWESAGSGFDVTPSSAVDRTGRSIAILTGALEEHITADVAWGVSCYAAWTGDRRFASGPGRELLAETARYWASRIRLDADGRGHIDGVIGPDEYHESVDDNAFTNVMARWNLRTAAATAAPEEERRRWLELAGALVDGYDPASGLYEQFAGFFALEPLVIADVAPKRPIAAEPLLGRERVASAQVVKQADVLMLHSLVPEEVAPGSLVPNLLFYEPRTAHGSSLSPGVHAALFARAGRLDRAVELLRLTSRIDLDDLTGTTAGGLHLAAMGSLWRAFAFGFLGMRPDGRLLRLDPRLPEQWRSLEAGVRFRGKRIRVRAAQERLEVFAEAPLAVAAGDERALAGPSGVRFERRQDRWEAVSA